MRQAAFALGKMGQRALGSLPDMKAVYVKESDVKVREAIVFALGEICRDTPAAGADPAMERLFLGALGDANPYVRRSSVYALGCLASKSDDTRQAIVTALRDDEAIVRQNAAWAAGRLGVDGLPSVKKALRDTDSLVKRDAASALLPLAEDADKVPKVHELLKDLLPLCQDKNSEARRAALNVLVRIVDKEAIVFLRSALDDTDLENRRNAAFALSNIGGDETVAALPVLLDAIKTGDPELRRQAVLAIRNIGPAASAAVPELIRVLQVDKDTKMREHAPLALGGIGKASEPAIATLVNKIQDPSEERAIRIECAMALQRIGQVPAAVRVVPDLLGVLADTKHDTKVRERIMWSLRVHGENLRTMKGPLETFTKILGEPLDTENRMLRYDCAYMLGMVWGDKAPEAALDVLKEFLHDDKIKIYVATSSNVGGSSAETKIGVAKVAEQAQGDGRIMATNALLRIGPARYSKRGDIVKQLRVLADDEQLHAPVRKMAIELVKAAK